MKHNTIVLIALLLGLILFGCKKQEQETLSPKIAKEKVETTATTAIFTWTVDWPGKLISAVEVSENEDMSHSQIYGSETETENHNFTVTVSDLKDGTKYYYRYLVWNKYYVDNKYVMEKREFGVDFVDLGLLSGTLWATCNVGALLPKDHGDYFAWGETQPKDYYDWSTYIYGSKWNQLTKYCSSSPYGYNYFTDNLTTLLPEDDAATANWGSDWRMPTKEEWIELYSNTTSTWTTQDGVNGRLFTASNGNSLFLPAVGYLRESSFYDVSCGHYWSSSLYTGYPDNSIRLYFNSDDYNIYVSSGNCNRSWGRSIRPVRSSK